MIALIASFFSLCVGPLVYQTFGPLKRTDKIVSGLVQVVVIGIIIFEIIPHTYQTIGIIALLLPLAGFAGPTLIERSFKRAADTTHKLTIYLGLFGLLVHAFIDGAALQTEQHEVNNSLTLAIILHRLPVGLTIWWMLKPLLGERYALVTLLLMGLSTVAGFAFNQAIGDYENNTVFALIQAFIAGSLLHVVIHKPHSDGCMHTNLSHLRHAAKAHLDPGVAPDIDLDVAPNIAPTVAPKVGQNEHSHDHDHDHHDHHSHKTPQDTIIPAAASTETVLTVTIATSFSVRLRQLILRWESVGMVIGLIILAIIQRHH